MRIGIDAQALTSLTYRYGIGRVTFGFIKALATYDRENQYFLFRIKGEKLPIHSPFEVVDVPFNPQLAKGLDANFEYGKSVAKLANKLAIDVYHVTAPVTEFTHFPVLTNCGMVTTFHDLIPVVMGYYPGYYPPSVYANYLQKLLLATRFITKFAAVSNCTKKDMVDWLRIWPSRVDVVYPAVDDLFMSAATTRSKRRSGKPYLLHVGNASDPRKNLALLLRAFSKLPKTTRSQFDLVLTADPDARAKLHLTALSEGISDNVKLVEQPDDRTIASLYEGCTALVMPSLYEGFGLPLLEAMAYSKPILASDYSSIPEVVGDAALLFDPRDPEDATRKMEMLLGDESLQTRLGRRARERLSMFTWEKSAQELVKVYKSAFDETKPGNGGRVAYFSLLYPTQSGIAHYSTELLKELAPQINVDVFVDTAKRASQTGCYTVRLRDWSEFEDHSTEYALAIYQMGNSTYQSWMLRCLFNRPGIVVLHDFNLHNFLLRYSLENDDELLYISAMAFQYGEDGLLIAEQQLNARGTIGDYVHEYPLNLPVLLFAESVISVGKKILEFLTEHVHPPLTLIPLGANVLDVTQRQLKRVRGRELLNLKDTDLVFFIGGLIEREAYHQKQLSLCLSLFKRILGMKADSKMIICGITDDYVFAKLRDEVAHLGLDDTVVLRGCQNFPDDLDACAFAADVSINLRRDPNAQGSLSAVMDLSRGIPVIASNNELYSEFPDDCVWKVDEGAEEYLLYEYMKHLALNPSLAKEMGQRALEFTRNRSWKKIAASYLDVLHERGSRG